MVNIDNLNACYKVYVFWEGHKNWKNLHHQFDIVTVKSTVKILSIFVAFLENMILKAKKPFWRMMTQLKISYQKDYL